MRTLPADVARCGGASRNGDSIDVCPLRDECLRYVTPAIDHPWQNWHLPVLPLVDGDCEMQIPTGGK